MARKTKIKIKPSRLSKYFSRFLVLIVVLLISMIVLKGNADLRETIYNKVFKNNMAFAKINDVYKKYFGSSLPLSDNKDALELVSAEKLEYKSVSKYKDGAKLTIKENYAVPAMDSGIVIFSGEKDGYGKTVIIQRPDNIEVWYGNLKNASVSLYDYIKKGEIVGEADNTLYMVFYKEGKVLDYQKYL